MVHLRNSKRHSERLELRARVVKNKAGEVGKARKGPINHVRKFRLKSERKQE